MGKINSTKCKVGENEFDSKLEAEYFKHLRSRDDVVDIELQPQFTILPEFYIDCGRCGGDGHTPSPKTGNLIKCKLCRGTGERKRRGMHYTADFKVWYRNGSVEVIDVKGWANERFPIVRKLFEHQNGYELIVIKKRKGEWVKC